MTLKNQITISLVVVLALSILLVVLLIRPTYHDIKSNSQNLISQKKQLLTLENKIENIEQFREKHQEIQQNLTAAETVFINAEAPVNFISFLQKNAQNCQVSIEIFPSFPSKVGDDPWISSAFQLISNGSFPNFIKFLEKLESSPYLVEIKNLNINRLSEKELRLEKFQGLSVGDIEATLLIKTYAH